MTCSQCRMSKVVVKGNVLDYVYILLFILGFFWILTYMFTNNLIIVKLCVEC